MTKEDYQWMHIYGYFVFFYNHGNLVFVNETFIHRSFSWKLWRSIKAFVAVSSELISIVAVKFFFPSFIGWDLNLLISSYLLNKAIIHSSVTSSLTFDINKVFVGLHAPLTYFNWSDIYNKQLITKWYVYHTMLWM